ncbi:MAG: hypothetical protein Q9213_006627 [Squamulea squamosa]
MINQDHDSTDHQPQAAGDGASINPANMIQGYTSSANPVVAGFTPINQYFSPLTSEETTQTSVPQYRRLPRLLAQGNRRRPTRLLFPKEQTITHAFTVTKPLDHGSAPLQGKRDNPIEPSARAYSSTESTWENSLQTCHDPSSTGGLGSTYQAAFQHVPLAVPNKDNGRIAWSHIAEENSQGLPTATSFQPVLPSTSGNMVQLDPSDHRTSTVSEVERGSNGTVAGFTCQVLNPLGVMLPGQQNLAKPGHEDWDITIPGKVELPQVLPMKDHTFRSPWKSQSNEDDAINFSQFNNLLTSAGEDYLPMDVSETKGQMIESECNSKQDKALNTSPEFFRDSDAVSFSSLMDMVLSRSANKVFSSSTSQSFIESSSPCLQFPPGHQSVPNHEVSPDGFTPDKQSGKEGDRDDVGIHNDEEMYDDEEIEKGFLDFQSPTSAQVPPPSPPASPDQKRIMKTQWASPDTITPATSPAKSAVPFTTELTLSTPALAKKTPTPKGIPHLVSFDENGAPIPFIHPVFPVPIRDRSPILGLSSKTVLRTCFRIGEALNAGSTALRTRTDAVIELYARVTSSERPAGSVKQLFQFADIFSPDKPPFLKGTYGLWKGVPLWDADSKVFLGEKGKGKMCRVVGRIGREERSRGLEMTVLSVWEADWEDVGIVKGIYCG